MTGEELHQFHFLHRVKHLTLEWNWLVDEYGENMNAKLLHYTAGIPAFPHYAHAPMADEWAREAARITHATR